MDLLLKEQGLKGSGNQSRDTIPQNNRGSFSNVNATILPNHIPSSSSSYKISATDYKFENGQFVPIQGTTSKGGHYELYIQGSDVLVKDKASNSVSALPPIKLPKGYKNYDPSKMFTPYVGGRHIDSTTIINQEGNLLWSHGYGSDGNNFYPLFVDSQGNQFTTNQVQSVDKYVSIPSANNGYTSTNNAATNNEIGVTHVENNANNGQSENNNYIFNNRTIEAQQEVNRPDYIGEWIA
ncbi:hypothetical protein [Psychrobacter phenylpyruvicus]|uniref:Uncharacterized protein n=1 Tax=Psychrobacter phenylpyruvicus TaxID=29432 RepID=A0A379LJL0_9GAMM|nr:hypothetical protein [Psychrobacter phenylpyruvicus]SUD90611.1 Uncharacterised protein [Psychrobacter phenylpyruvicus]